MRRRVGGEGGKGRREKETEWWLKKRCEEEDGGGGGKRRRRKARFGEGRFCEENRAIQSVPSRQGDVDWGGKSSERKLGRSGRRKNEKK